MRSTLLTASTARLEERPRRDVQPHQQRTHLIVYNLRFSHKLFPTVKTNCEFPGPSKVSGGYVSSVRASGQVVRKNLVLLLICNHESVENLTSNLIFTAYLLPHRGIKLWSDVFFIVIPEVNQSCLNGWPPYSNNKKTQTKFKYQILLIYIDKNKRPLDN